MPYVLYITNNSGGDWWLKDDDWYALENAGWIVHWIHDINDPSHTHNNEDDYDFDRKGINHTHAFGDDVLVATISNGNRFLDGLAQSAALITDDPNEAVAEFERVAGQNADDEGCTCCGPPHSFSFHEDDGSYKSFSSRASRYERNWD